MRGVKHWIFNSTSRMRFESLRDGKIIRILQRMSLLYMTINNDSASIATFMRLKVLPQGTEEGEQVDNTNLDSSL